MSNRYWLRLFSLTGGLWSAAMAVITIVVGEGPLSVAFVVVASMFFAGFLLIEKRND